MTNVVSGKEIIPPPSLNRLGTSVIFLYSIYFPFMFSPSEGWKILETSLAFLGLLSMYPIFAVS